ncbi:MAG: flagellar type III secretion system pore protein FliP [Gaiellaceae bacterium]
MISQVSVDGLPDLGGGSPSIQVLVLLTLVTILPGILLTLTGFTRILIVLGFVRNALGTPTMPPNQVLVGIAFFLTLFVMGPTFTKVHNTAIKPFLNDKVTQQEAINRGLEPVRGFMFKQTRDSELGLFVKLAKEERPETRADVPTRVLVPAFVLSELKTAFQIGFLIFVPFLIIDMVVASTLMSMGMMMLPPILISLPFKILLFVLVDGWHLVVESIVNSFNP